MTLFSQVFQWWIVLFLVGIIALPFTTKLFGVFFDKGYTLSKIIGVVFISYLALVLGTMHLLPFTNISLFFIVFLCFTISVIFSLKTNFKKTIKGNWKFFLFEEIIFFGMVYFWSWIKTFQPDIHGLEKYMDFGFLNSILRSTYFPPKDMWMAPLTINYYYFGHLMTAVLTKLSHLPSNITFNLMLATLFACTFTESFSLASTLILLYKKHKGESVKLFVPIFWGGFTALILTFGGNFHTIYSLFTSYSTDNPVPPTQLVFSPQSFPNQYWYPNATRFIYHTIHEFPLYSFVVSDLHGHVLDIPTVLLILAIFLIIFIQPVGNIKVTMRNALLLGFLTGVAYMTNAWDGLIYLGVGILLLGVKEWNKKHILHSIYSIVLLVASFAVTSLPFSLFFKPFASQIGLNCAPDFLINIGNIGPLIFEKNYCQHSPLWQLIILYGFFLFWFFSFLFLIFREIKEKGKFLLVDIFVLGIGILGFLLIIIPEFVYLKDIYTTYFRANTMFKLVYQSFILLMIVSGYSAFRLLSTLDFKKGQGLKNVGIFWFYVASSLSIILILIYPFFAIPSYFNNLKNQQTLDGTAYLKKINPSDYKAINWINTHISGQPVMLEAQGDSYTDYERISSNTGLPTVFGWMVHEWLWRGTYSIVPGRIADVQALYESKNIEETKKLLQQYNISYVYIGYLERQKYAQLDEEKFSILGKIVYHQGEVTIYKIF